MEYKSINEILNNLTDYVANGSFKSLNENVTYYNKKNYARLIRLVDYNNNFSDNNAIYVDEISYNFLTKTKLYGGEIIISNVGANLGTVFKCPKLSYPMTLGPNSIMLKSTINDDYLYYYFSSEKGQKNILSLVSGSAMPKFNKTDFKKLIVPVPSIEEQQHIVDTIGSIDDLIVLKDNEIKKLELKANQLYEQVFNNDSVEKEMVNLNEIASFYGGYSYSGNELCEASNCALLTIKNFDRAGGFKNDGFKPLNITGNVKETMYCSIDDLLVAHTDLTQNAEIIGNPVLVLDNSNYEKLVITMDIVKIEPNEISKVLLYYILKDVKFKKYALGFCAGTTVLHLNKSALRNYSFDMPKDLNIITELTSKLTYIYDLIKNYIQQQNKLIELKQLYLNKFFN